jgi:hypothetical protein
MAIDEAGKTGQESAQGLIAVHVLLSAHDLDLQKSQGGRPAPISGAEVGRQGFRMISGKRESGYI